MITFGCLLLLIGICRIYWEELYFFGIETETILLVPDGHMTLTDYENAVSDIKQQISSFAKKQYITEKDGKISKCKWKINNRYRNRKIFTYYSRRQCWKYNK